MFNLDVTRWKFEPGCDKMNFNLGVTRWMFNLDVTRCMFQPGCDKVEDLT